MIKSCLSYRAARDQIKSTEWSNTHIHTSQKQTGRNFSQFTKPTHTTHSAIVEPHSPTSSSSITTTTVIEGYYSGDVSGDERLPCSPTQQAPLLMVVPQVLTLRQIENKKLADNHKNINKKLSAGALIRKEAAQRTRLWLHEVILVRQTESNRQMHVVGNNVRYIETSYGIEYNNKIYKSAKMRAVLMLNDPQYHGESAVGFT